MLIMTGSIECPRQLVMRSLKIEEFDKDVDAQSMAQVLEDFIKYHKLPSR